MKLWESGGPVTVALFREAPTFFIPSAKCALTLTNTDIDCNALKMKMRSFLKGKMTKMSMLENAKIPSKEPMIATICGNPGTGKTSLAATFPKAFLIRTQGEALPRDVPDDKMPLSLDEVSSEAQLWDQLLALCNEEHDFKTLIIDSVTGLEGLFTAEVLNSDPKAKGIQTALGGYGAGRDAVAAKHARVRKAAETLRKRRGMNVVFIAHADVNRIDPPDSEGYSQYTLRLHSKSMAPYVDSVDLVGFIKQQTVLRGDEGNRKAVTTGERVLTTYLTPATISKNRYGISEDIDFVQGENPLAPWIDQATARKTKPRAAKRRDAEIVADDPSSVRETEEVDPADFSAE